MRKILCPVDFGDAATNAIEYAARLASVLNAELTLFHVVNEPSLETTTSSFFPVEEKERIAITRLEAACKTTHQSFDIKCKPIVRRYTPGVENSIMKEIEADNYNMVVMGTNGPDEVRQFLFGTHTYSIARKITKPLLMVPEGCSYKKLKKIVFASDYKTEDIETLNRLIEFTTSFHPEITILHIGMEKPEKGSEVFSFIKEVYGDRLNGEKINFEYQQSENVPEALDSFMKENESDLLVLLTSRYSFFEMIFHRSVTRKMSMLADYPVLIDHVPLESY